MNQNYLVHYGVLGMKWGVRRQKGTLSSGKQKRLSKKYKKYSVDAMSEIGKTHNKRYVDAHNKTADEWNNGKINEFNKTHKPSSKTYDDDMMNAFQKDLTRNFNAMTIKELTETKSFQKGQALAKKYDMIKFDDLVRVNEKIVNPMKKGGSK